MQGTAGVVLQGHSIAFRLTLFHLSFLSAKSAAVDVAATGDAGRTLAT